MSIESEERWFARNWAWAVPTGCLSFLVAFALLVVVLMAGVMAMFRETEVYPHAMGLARANPAVVAALGTPIEDGWYMTGEIQVTPATGNADISIPLEGPSGDATLYVVAHKSGGQWRYETIVVELADGTRIPLVEEPDAAIR